MQVLISTRIAGEVENHDRNQGVDDTKDANRHAEWSRQMAIEQGAAIARAAGDALEQLDDLVVVIHPIKAIWIGITIKKAEMQQEKEEI